MDKQELLEEFYEHYENLVDIEQRMGIVCDLYCKGESTKLTDLDELVSEMKQTMKKVRKLAREVKK